MVTDTELIAKISWPPPGKYVVAVSGGVDSMALLDLLVQRPELQLEVAHFHHGWSEAATGYVAAVKQASDSYGLKLYVGRERVDKNEAAARTARYRFLRQVAGGRAIVTAHHQDDLIETALLNLERGTGRRGLSPFGVTPDVVRPLVAVSKAELTAYASARGLSWVEDPTNTDMNFRRNALRHGRLPLLRKENVDFDLELLAITAEAAELNQWIDTELRGVFATLKNVAQADLLPLRQMSVAVLSEVIVLMARSAQPGAELGKRTVEALAVDLKVGRFRTPRRLSRSLFASRSRDKVTITFSP